MSHIVLYVLGAPGVGKTTLVRELLGTNRSLIAKPKWTLGPGVAAAGHYTGQTFDGGDTVPYSGARECLEYWSANLLPALRATPSSLTILDGDRFSTGPSLEYLRATGEPIVGVHLTADEATLESRRAARGSNQNATWLKGRVTKAGNFAVAIAAVGFDAGRRPTQELVVLVRGVLAARRLMRGAA